MDQVVAMLPKTTSVLEAMTKLLFGSFLLIQLSFSLYLYDLMGLIGVRRGQLWRSLVVWHLSSATSAASHHPCALSRFLVRTSYDRVAAMLIDQRDIDGVWRPMISRAPLQCHHSAIIVCPQANASGCFSYMHRPTSRAPSRSRSP